MTKTQSIRHRLNFLENHLEVVISTNEPPGHTCNCELVYRFPNCASIRIWTDRSDFYVNLYHPRKNGIHLSELCQSPAVSEDEHLAMLHARWLDTVVPWLDLSLQGG